jgi:outer membrane protein OmpA-like peptidoglycan-associated protein
MSMPDTQQQEPQENSHHLLLIALFALSMIILLVISIVLIAPEIEKDLNQKVMEELEKKGIEATVTLSGRDVTLSGTVTTSKEIQQAQTSTTKICGIHFIDNQLVPHDKLATAHKPPVAPQHIAQKKQIPQQIVTDSTTLHPLPEKNTPLATNDESISNKKNNASSFGKTEEKSSHTLQEKTVKQEKKSTTYKSSEAYEKILAAMSRYNENKKIASTMNTQDKTAIDFDASTIQFKKNTSTLTSSAKKSLVLLAVKLKNTEKTIEIIVSSKKSDTAFNRAKKIQHYLIKQGLKKKHLIIIGRTSNTGNTVTIVESGT